MSDRAGLLASDRKSILVSSLDDAFTGHLGLLLGCQSRCCCVSEFTSTGDLRVTTRGSVDSRDVIVVHRLDSDVHRSLFAHLLLLRAAREGGASRVVSLIPYMPYGRSERRYDADGPLALGLVVDAVACAGADALITLDLHARASQSRGRLVHVDVSLASGLASVIRLWKREGSFLVAPDRGSASMVRALGSEVGLDCVVFDKTRAGDCEVAVKRVGGESGRRADHAIVVDDALYTGSTLRAIAEHLLAGGVSKIDVAVTHFLPSAITAANLRASEVQRLAVSDSIPHVRHALPDTAITVLRAADTAAEALGQVLSDPWEAGETIHAGRRLVV